MTYVTAYIAALITFAIVDAAWLYFAGSNLYKPVLGDMLAPEVRLGPATAFYLLFPLGITIFATDPAIKANSVTPALIYGALFGIFTYATYDLTNFATLKNWSLKVTIIDISYGAILCALSAAAAYAVVKTFVRN